MTRTDPEQTCPESLCLVTSDYSSGHVCLVLGEDWPQWLWTAVDSRGHERNARKKEETEAANLQRKFTLGGRHLVMKLSRASDGCVSRIISQ